MWGIYCINSHKNSKLHIFSLSIYLPSAPLFSRFSSTFSLLSRFPFLPFPLFRHFHRSLISNETIICADNSQFYAQRGVQLAVYAAEKVKQPSLVQYLTVLYCTVLYCTVLYCTVLYCTVLYCILNTAVGWVLKVLLYSKYFEIYLKHVLYNCILNTCNILIWVCKMVTRRRRRWWWWEW